MIPFSETIRNLNPERRKRLAEYVMLVSQGWTILPAPFIVEPEIEDACLKHLGLPRYDLRNFAIRKGLSQLVSAKADLEIESKDPNNPFPQERIAELKKYLLDKLESPETLLFLMELGVSQSFVEKQQRDAIATTKRLEEIRRSWRSRIRGNNLLRRAILADYLIYEIGPKLIPFLSSIQSNPKILIDNVSTNQETIIRFFQSMPTSYCNVQLTLYRDMQRRRIQPNDLHDIMSLSIAIPYSDVVVTETMWQTAIIQTKLDELYQTTVLKSAKGLASILESR